MKKNKIILTITLTLIVVLGGFLILSLLNKEKTNPDAQRFAEEYNSVSEDNVFTYRTPKEIIKILKHGTGIVYLGFPECPWCTEYVYHLNEVAKENDVEEIYYLNIREDRQNNTEDYQEIVKLLEEHLQYDNEGNKRIYVPAVIAVKDGNIIDFDDETAWDTKGYKTPQEYWQNEDLEGLKTKLENMFNNVNKNICTSDCNK